MCFEPEFDHSPASSRWSSGKDASDGAGGFRPGDEELDALPLHPEPEGLFLLCYKRAKPLQPGGPPAAGAAQLLLQTSLCQHHGGI